MKKLLVVVDYQNDFVTGTLGFDGAKELEPYIASLIKEYKSNGDDVIFTLDTHQDDYYSYEEGKHLKVMHCQRGTEGHNLYGSIQKLSGGSLVFEKRAFPSSQLCFYLRGQEYNEVTLVGVVSNICVFANAIMVKAALPKAHIIIDAKGCASNDKELEQKSFDVARGMFIEVKNG